jgi:predicted Zn-dependent protease
MNLFIFLCIFIVVESFPTNFPQCDDLCRNYLIEYEYIDGYNNHNLVHLSEDKIKQGILKLQTDAGLEKTGIMDKNTIKIINTPRCGVKSSFNERVKRFVTFKAFNTTIQNEKNETVIKWFVDNTIKLQQLDNSFIQRTINHAFQIWANTSLLYFEKVNVEKEANIVIKFVKGDHGDGFPFDGPGRVLGHAFFPGSHLEGHVHLDLDEKWSIYGYNNTINLLHTSIHELGHALGLGHSSQNKSIMYAWYNPSIMQLSDDDTFAINDLYGVRPRYRFGPIYNAKTPPYTTTTAPYITTTKRYNMNLFKRLIIENSKVSMYLKS